MKGRIVSISVCAALLAMVLTGCADRSRYILISGYAQGGTYGVKVNLKGVHTPDETIRKGIDSILTLVDTTLSGYNKGSILSRFNRGETVRPNRMFLDMYRSAYSWWKVSGGALDFAAGPLFDVWGFGFSKGTFPTEDTLRTILSRCGMSRLRPTMEEVLSPDGTLSGADLIAEGHGNDLPRLNYNAIAQGFTSDCIARYLYGLGARDMLVDIGEIWCDGVNPSGRPWAVGVDRPFDGNDTPGADLDGIWESDGGGRGVVTSGNYRKFFIKDGKKYSHTLDPRTGYPVEGGLLSATIISSVSSEAADAIATWCMVSGAEAAREIILSDGTLEGYLITASDGDGMDEWASPGFRLRPASNR